MMTNTADPRRCNRCIMDSTASDIWFDALGECKFCKIHDEMESHYPLGGLGSERLQAIVTQIKKAGKNKHHDCIVGVSGGRDSSYCLLTAVRLGLKPLAVHFDNGWNTEIAVQNIKSACEILGVELLTIVADWEEFKDLQIAFLKSSTPDVDIPTDFAIYSVLYQAAKSENIKYILNGHSFRTEGTSPISWTYMDPLYIRSVLKACGTIKRFKSFPHMTLTRLQYFIWIRRIREVRILEYSEYNKSKVDGILKKELNWKDYGGHHHENAFTKFVQSYYLPVKFGIDKRKTEFSALIRSAQMRREDAVSTVDSSEYGFAQENVDYVREKLALTQEEWKSIMAAAPRSNSDFRSLLPLMRRSKWLIKIVTDLHLLPRILYLKYAS